MVPSFVKNLLQRMQKHSAVSFQVETGPVLNLREGEVAVMTYTSTADKMKVFSAFIREGIESGDRVHYIYPDEESGSIRAKLEEYGIDVEKHERIGTLYMKSLTEHYLPDGHFNAERSIKKGLDLRTEARSNGYKHVRVITDVGNFSFLKGEWQTYIVDYWDNPKWGASSGVGILYEPFLIELTALNIGGVSEAQARDILKTFRDILKVFGGGKYSPTKFIDLLEYADAFSKRIDMSHQELLGCKFLLEFDSVSAYEKIVEDFAKEAMANLEPIFVFTSSNSVIHASLAEKSTARFFLMSVSKSAPEKTSESEIVLPASNTPLVLDSINKILETYTEENVFIVFDGLSELILLVGVDRAYKFLLYALDMLSLERIVTMCLLNSSVHDPTVVSQIRGLFPNILTYDKNGLKVVKLPSY